MNTLEEAINNVTLTNDKLVEVAKEIASTYTKPIDDIIDQVSKYVNTLDNNALRALITDLSFNAYSLGEAKEYSLLKSEVADAIAKETLAIEYNTATGTVDARKNQATLNSSNEHLTEMLYTTVAGLLKVKLDEVHRMIDTLKTVITSRNTEAKINQNITDVREVM